MSSPHSAGITETIVIDGVEIQLETGRMARQANAAVTVRSGNALLLATVVSAPEPRPGADFFPLQVEYRERTAAGGRIPGSRNRREGRITDQEILTSRFIDRSMRPLFPKGFRCDTQIQITVYSADPACDLESLGIIGASAALHISDVPFNGPVAGLRICSKSGKLECLLGDSARDRVELELMVSGSRNGIVMVEGRASVLSEERLLDALDTAEIAISELLDTFDRLREKAGKSKRPFEQPQLPADVVDAVKSEAEESLRAAIAVAGKHERYAALAAVRQATLEALAKDPSLSPDDVEAAFDKLRVHLMRDRTLEGQRLDGRAHDVVRPINVETGLLASNHGSALFTRGETQALVSATLGGDRDALPRETVYDARLSDSFILHYNFPPFSVGETRPLRGPGRREIGHGNLARTAILPVLPESGFPYVLRVVSDILESNGSSSMATVCGTSLALMDAGVPLSAPVAGVAMGLIKEGERVAILTDILGDEDHFGDMDFKVTGTAEGVTAVQLDNKLGSLPRDLLAKALTQAKAGRLHILDAMSGALDAPRTEVAAHAPQTVELRVSPDRIGSIIGPGGKVIKAIQAETSSRVSIDNDGTVRIFADDRKSLHAAKRRVEMLALELRKDGVYLADVVNIKDFGAFVRIGDHEGLVHISELAEERVESVSAVVSMGDSVLVRVIGVDDRGKIKLSRRAALGVDRSQALNA